MTLVSVSLCLLAGTSLVLLIARPFTCCKEDVSQSSAYNLTTMFNSQQPSSKQPLATTAQQQSSVLLQHIHNFRPLSDKVAMPDSKSDRRESDSGATIADSIARPADSIARADRRQGGVQDTATVAGQVEESIADLMRDGASPLAGEIGEDSAPGIGADSAALVADSALSEKVPHPHPVQREMGFFAERQAIKSRWLQQPVLVLVGGRGGDTDLAPPPVEAVATSLPCQLSLPQLPRHMWDPMVGLVETSILLCDTNYSNYDADGIDTRCWSTNLTGSRRWRPLPGPPVPLYLPAATVYQGLFYMIGGSSLYMDDRDLQGTKHVQIFDNRCAVWKHGPSLPYPLYSGCAVGTEHGLVVVGDFEGGLTNAYILREKKWYSLPESFYDHTKPGCGLGLLDGRWVVVVVSGRQAEYLRLGLDATWLPLPSLLEDHADVASVGMTASNLVVAGGFNSNHLRANSHVERLVEEEDGTRRWTYSHRDLMHPRYKQGSLEIPLYLLPNCSLPS